MSSRWAQQRRPQQERIDGFGHDLEGNQNQLQRYATASSGSQDGPSREKPGEKPNTEACLPPIPRLVTSLPQQVRVAVRVRPIAREERLRGCVKCAQVREGRQIVLSKDRGFTFDIAYGPKSSQVELFENGVYDLVQRCFEGYNATVLAYGQTGSGKTYTMGMGVEAASLTLQALGGELEHSLDPSLGLAPRVCFAFSTICQALPSHIESFLSVSYLEIYNESVRDLLAPVRIGKSRPTLNIRDGGTGNLLVQGVTEVPVKNITDMIAQLEVGAQARTTGSTQMNSESSRSHAIFTINLEQRGGDTWKQRSAKFHLVDLAGSERNKRTMAVGERFQESIQINQGLLALGNVISILGDERRQQSAHVPYRQSKLTRLLRDSLGGNSHTLFVACISPTDDSLAETLNTLKYANRARNIKNLPILNGLQPNLSDSESDAESSPSIIGSSPAVSRKSKDSHLKKRHANPRATQDYSITPDDTLFNRIQALESRERDWEHERLSLLNQITAMGQALAAPMQPDHSECDSRIEDLRSELEEARADLERDEIIFSKKMEELQQTRRQLRQLQTESVAYKKRLIELEEENQDLLCQSPDSKLPSSKRDEASSQELIQAYTHINNMENQLRDIKKTCKQELRAESTSHDDTRKLLQQAETTISEQRLQLEKLEAKLEVKQGSLGLDVAQLTSVVDACFQGDPVLANSCSYTPQLQSFASLLMNRLKEQSVKSKAVSSLFLSRLEVDQTTPQQPTYYSSNNQAPQESPENRIEQLDQDYITSLERQVRYLRRQLDEARCEVRSARKDLENSQKETVNLNAFLKRQGMKLGAVSVRMPRAQLAEINLNAA
eukprot:CAMPEP_0171548300 /NCGR_PEP_ID=MMETSP0960-20121227/5748_1 /TAXON_ID=87120 /ORGANISM="Aurantiochytrium limacinum, Strain ATCCMYA-1381" /LENGTH=838 /DNA_ID=CAMNT_0012096741 /DNA_START=34 /DNA_END=2550 /DNA_ORIENTATION=-